MDILQRQIEDEVNISPNEPLPDEEDEAFEQRIQVSKDTQNEKSHTNKKENQISPTLLRIHNNYSIKHLTHPVT